MRAVGTTKSGLSRRVDLRQGWPAVPPWVFCNTAGSPLDPSRVSRAFKRVLKKAGLPRHYTPHCLRHTYASLMLQQGESVTYVQRQTRARLHPAQGGHLRTLVADGQQGGCGQARRASTSVSSRVVAESGSSEDASSQLVASAGASARDRTADLLITNPGGGRSQKTSEDPSDREDEDLGEE